MSSITKKFDYLTAERNLDGTINLTVSFVDSGGLYDAYVIRRKEIEFPTSETNGWGIDSGAVAGGLTLTLLDDEGIVDGVVYYYTLFLRLAVGGTYIIAGQAYCMGLVPEFTSVSDDIVPDALQGESTITARDTVGFFKTALLDPVFGEIEALIRNMVPDVDRCDPHVLSFLVRMLGWWPSPVMELGAFRTQVKSLPTRFRNKGQIGVSLDLLEEVSGVTCGLHTYDNNILISNTIDNQRILEKTIFGVGDGVTDTFTFSGTYPIVRGTVVVTSNGVDLTDDCSGVLRTATGVAAGTIDYDNGDLSAVFPAGSIPPNGIPVWVDMYIQCSVFSLTDPELHTRMEYIGDRMMYSLSHNPEHAQTGSRCNVYLFLHLEVGEEGIVSFSDSYDKLIVDDVERKTRVFWPLGLDTRWHLMDRVVISDIHDIAAAHLPLEQEAGVFDGS